MCASCSKGTNANNTLASVIVMVVLAIVGIIMALAKAKH
jgi:hypothetical protein